MLLARFLLNCLNKSYNLAFIALKKIWNPGNLCHLCFIKNEGLLPQLLTQHNQLVKSAKECTWKFMITSNSARTRRVHSESQKLMKKWKDWNPLLCMWPAPPPHSYPLHVYVLCQWSHIGGLNLWLLRRSSLGSGPTPSPPYSLSRIPHRHTHQHHHSQHAMPNSCHHGFDSCSFLPALCPVDDPESAMLTPDR